MPRISRKAKKVHKIKFCDGQIYTILDIEPDPQTSDVTLHLKKNVGVEFLLIPGILFLSFIGGNFMYGMNGGMVALMLGGGAGVILMRELSFSQGIKRITMPQSSIIGFDNYFQLKSKSYCFCMPKNEEVICNPEIKSINEIKVGDNVLTHNGSFQKVVKLFERDYDGDCIKVSPGTINFPFIVTPEHPIYSVKREEIKIGSYENAYKNRYWKKDAKIEPKWNYAKDLKVGDYLAYPIINDIEDVKTILISVYWKGNLNKGARYALKENWWIRSNPNGTKQIIPNEIIIDNETMEFFGWYVAEGSSDKKGYVTLTLAKKEMEVGLKLIKFVQKKFNVNPVITDRGSYFFLRFGAKPIALMLRNLFGTYSYEKKVPNWFLKLPQNKQESFLVGLFSGDGNVTKMGHISYVTTSKLLAFQVLQLLLRNHYYISFGKYKKISETRHERYMFYVSKFKHLKKHWSFFNNNYLFIRIRDIKTFPYQGYVYNLEVENSNSYTALGACLHNCTHTYDSMGNPVMSGHDPVAIMENQLNEREWLIKFLRDQVMTLRYNVYEMLKSRKELSDEVAGELKKMIESTVTQVKTRVERPEGYPYPGGYPPTGGETEEEA